MTIDYLGNEIKLNDTVVFMQLKYRNLLKGKVIKITNKMVVIEHEKTNTCSTQSKQYQGQVIVVTKVIYDKK